MVGATQQPPPQPKRPTAVITTTTSTSAEEEALKRNTDCVYFLASPLTCKKGSECEYRHSDIARVNPRDCWYWLNGNCLNPKCGFRHPPLDGLLGSQVPTPTGASLPTSQTAATPPTLAPNTSGKQAVPCIFFQKGFCLKGDRCSFLHAPNAINNNKVPQASAMAPVTEPPTFKKTFGALEKCTQEHQVAQASVPKSVELPMQAKPVAKVETAPPKNGDAIVKNVPPPSGLDYEISRYRPTSVPPASNEYSMSRSSRVYQAHVSDDHNFLNGKDADEFSREPSPGFDVLVDDERRDSDYYHNEDQFGRTRAQEGRNLNPTNEYDIGRAADYDSMADVEQDIYRDPHGYDLYDQMQGQYGWEQRRASSERMLGGLAHAERRRQPRGESPDQIDESDLRHRLSKQRRVNGLRSVISHDNVRDDHGEDRSYQGQRREVHHVPTHESSVSSRLRGRIKIPGRSSSPLNGTDLRPEREMDKGRNRGRLSLGRPQIASHQESVRDRIKGRVQEDFNNEGRNFRGSRMRRDMINDNYIPPPKSLAELKVGKNADRNEQQISYQQSFSLGKRKYPNLEGDQQFEGDLSFEGPKPLSEILKRKREVETTVSGGDLMMSAYKEDNIMKERRESLISSEKTTAVTEVQGIFSSLVKEEADLPVDGNKEESKTRTANSAGIEDGLIPTENLKSADEHPSLQHNVSELDIEDGMIVDDRMEDQEPEPYEREGESDYEQVDGEESNLDGADPEEEYLEDDDGDDFAKKIGVMFS
ncbi:hypothetical protein F0562_034458 [Nyssa sinensis]|uniref:C3H1-type domain-containing protein n=1 Tax=Nyssa sinensis TaxID=561372 RepID=A0A5J5AIG1_9ASTE|nr:hypothetical protein F0562_034458 [Nyssa sinensis]